MTLTAGPVVKRLYREFGDQLMFLTVYVREAHPGVQFPQPQRFEEKIANARQYRTRDDVPWPVAVDDIDGTLHQTLDGKPNSVYLIDREGRVAYRQLWANQYDPLRRAIRQLLSGQSPVGENESKMSAVLQGMGVMHEVLDRSAERDLRHEAPPIYWMERLADRFRPLPPMGRGIAAVASALTLTGLTGWIVIRSLRHAGPD